MLDGLSRPDNRGIKHLLVGDLARKLVSLADQTVNRGTFDALWFFPQLLKDLIETHDLILDDALVSAGMKVAVVDKRRPCPTVTTFVELEAKLLAAAITEANFARAKSDLRLANVLQNGRGSLEDCAVFLSDDGRSALAFAFWNDDTKTICASFELGRPASESEFDHNTWTARLMQGDEWPTM